MQNDPYLLFKVYGKQYGLVATAVEEVFLLPAVQELAQLPAPFVGVITLRNKILPIADLSAFCEETPQPYTVNDSLIVINIHDQQVGLLVHDILGLTEIAPSQLSTTLSQRITPGSSTGVTMTLASVDANVIALIDAEALILRLASIFSTVTQALANDQPTNGEAPVKPPLIRATPKEQAILQQRADNLRSPLQTDSISGQLPFAVIKLQGEYFGLDSNLVEAFTDIRNPTPIPCTPAHIIGNVNLRGEILTLVDISHMLNLPMGDPTTRQVAVVVRVRDLVVGITVDDVLDVVYINPSDICPVPIAVRTMHDSYLRGVTSYQHHAMTVLDLPHILTQGELVVNETI